MTDLRDDIYQLADTLIDLGDPWAKAVSALLDIYETEPPADGLDLQTTALVGEESLTTLTALIVEDKADAKPVTDLPAEDRTATRHALLGIAADLIAATHSNRAEHAAWRLNPA